MISKTNTLDRKGIDRRTGLLKTVRKNSVAWLLILPSILCLYFFSWRPIFSGTYLSFFELRGYEPVKFIGLKNYIQIFSDTQFLRTLANTLKYVFWRIAIGFWPPIVIAIMLNEMRHFRKSFQFAIYFPCLVPGIVVSMLWKLMYTPDITGLLNNMLSIFGVEPQLWLNSESTAIICIVASMSWNAMGSSMIYYLAALQGINKELYEAALIDGAGLFSRIKNITLPQISGIILLLFVRMLIGIFQVMEQPLVMTDGGPNGASMSLGLQAYRYAFENFAISKSLALGVIEFLMLIGFTIFYFYVQNRVETE